MIYKQRSFEFEVEHIAHTITFQFKSSLLNLYILANYLIISREYKVSRVLYRWSKFYLTVRRFHEF